MSHANLAPKKTPQLVMQSRHQQKQSTHVKEVKRKRKSKTQSYNLMMFRAHQSVRESRRKLSTENPAPRAFKRLRPLKSKSSQDVTTTPPEKKKKQKKKDQEVEAKAAEPGESAPEKRQAKTKAGQLRKRQAKEKQEAQTKATVDSKVPATRLRSKKAAQLVEVKKSKSSEDVNAPAALPKAAPKRTAAKSQPSQPRAPPQNEPDGAFDLMAES